MMHYRDQIRQLRISLLNSPVIDRGSWQSQKITDEMRKMHELRHVTVRFPLPDLPHQLAELTGANMPWAEDHFQERVGGKPLNPPPSAAWWPYAQAGHADHTNEENIFSHTYPERFWPKKANVEVDACPMPGVCEIASHNPHVGIRFEYGDFGDLLDQLVENPYTRQAYLPIWFPEDLAAARQSERVPCTLGYHFLATDNKVDITYSIRSCDFVRHFADDVYMAGRLCQWVVATLNEHQLEDPDDWLEKPWECGEMIMHIGSFHCFVGDRAKLELDKKQADREHHERISRCF